MSVVLQGSLQHFAPRELLAFIAAAHSGTFDAESGGQHVRLALRDGKVVGAEGNGDAAGVMARLLGWSDGTFSFLDEIVLPDIEAQELPALFAAAEERIVEARRLAHLFPDDSVTLRVVNRPPEAISLSPEEFQILFQVGTGKSLARLRVATGRAADELYPIVKRLESAGLIEVLSHSGVTARGAVPVPPPAPAPVAPPAPSQAKTTEQQAPVMIGTLTAQDGTMHPLLEEISTIGRTPVNTIVLTDGSVSARHARVDRTPDGFVIEDAGSRNGTYINSEKLSEKRLLTDGDLVRLGKIILTFNLASDLKRKQSTEREMMT
jgi:hypothetical protein